jgi:ATPase subunit of ABC transporter with duplicated ATPase domains
MISVSNVSVRYGSKVLFDEVTTSFTPGKRYGLTGPNGAGKSTFMNLLTGALEPQKGTVARPRKLGVLRQDQFAFDRLRVLDTVIMGNQRLWSAMEERDRIHAQAELTDADGMRLAELEGIIGEEDGYSAESDAAILLEGLDIPDVVHERTMGELQGGQKVRVLLAQALFGHPQALLLDEPTNHLDLESIHWLQAFLNGYDGVVIVISHDRHFLNRVCTHIADIDYETIITYVGTYDDMVVMKTRVRGQLEGQNAQREKKIAQLNDFIARFSAGTRSSQVQSRRKEVERLQVTELAKSNIQRPYLKFEPKRPSGKHVLEIEGISQSYGDVLAIRDFSASVSRGEKVALMGRNGAGKSTLLKTAAGLIDPVRGRVGAPAGIALLTQNPSDYLVRERVGDELPGEAGMAALRVVGLEHALDADPRDLSGGERQRLALAIALAGRMEGDELPGTVALDEPTRGMDRARKDELIELIEQLSSRGAAVLVATHDVEFAAAFAERVVLLGEGVVIADGSAAGILSGGWYFATEVARVLDLPGVVTPEQGAAVLCEGGR